MPKKVVGGWYRVSLTQLACLSSDGKMPVLEPTQQAVLDTRKMLDEARISEQCGALGDAAGQVFYNTSKFARRGLRSRGSHQRLLADFEELVRKFNEENNEEAGEHWTPRDAVTASLLHCFTAACPLW